MPHFLSFSFLSFLYFFHSLFFSVLKVWKQYLTSLSFSFLFFIIFINFSSLSSTHKTYLCLSSSLSLFPLLYPFHSLSFSVIKARNLRLPSLSFSFTHFPSLSWMHQTYLCLPPLPPLPFIVVSHYLSLSITHETFAFLPLFVWISCCLSFSFYIGKNYAFFFYICLPERFFFFHYTFSIVFG